MIWAQGDLNIQNVMIIKDKILISGSIKYNILIKDKEEQISTLESTKDFNEEINIHKIKEEMIANVKGNIEYIEYELEENKISIKTLINLDGQVENLKTLEIIKSVEDADSLETQEESLNYRQSYGRDRSIISIEEKFSIEPQHPEVDEVLKFFVDPVEIESTVINDRIILSGEAIVTLILSGEGEIYSTKENITFNHFLEVPGAIEGSNARISLSVEDAEYEILKNDEDELRVIDVSLKIEAIGSVYREDSKTLLLDAYSIKEELEILKEEVTLLEEINTLDHNEEISLEIPINAIDVLDIKKQNKIIEKSCEDNRVKVEGLVSLNIYYIDRIEGEIDFFTDEFPYKIEIPYDENLEGCILDIKEEGSKLEFNLKRDNIEVETNVALEIALKREKNIFAIKDIISTGNLIDKKTKPSITIYIVQRGDVLWDIAKRYNTTMHDILSSNGLPDNYELKVGDKIIIEKNINLEL